MRKRHNVVPEITFFFILVQYMNKKETHTLHARSNLHGSPILAPKKQNKNK